MTDLTDVSDVKMTRFGNRVYLFRKKHVRVKDEAKIATKNLVLRKRVVLLQPVQLTNYQY